MDPAVHSITLVNPLTFFWKPGMVLLRWPLTRIRNAWRDLLRDCGAHISDDLGRELLTLAASGVGIHFFFSTGDPGETLLRVQGGRAVGRLQQVGKLTVERIPGADHDLSFHRDRVFLLQHLLALLRREPASLPDPAPLRSDLPFHLRSS